MALDSGGNVYVADYINNRVVVLTSMGAPLRVYGQGGDFTSDTQSNGGAVSAGGLSEPC